MTSRRFPPPVERLPGGFKVIDANGHTRQAAKLTGERGVRGHPHIQGSPSRSGGGIFVIPDQPIESDTGYLAEFT